MAAGVDAELIEILKNISLGVDARSKGWEYILGLTADEDGLNHIIESGKYIPFILSHINESKVEKELKNLAYKCLINISNKQKGAYALLESKKDFFECLLRSICEENESCLQAKCYILSNLSACDEINKKITETLASSKDLLPKLMNIYCSNNSTVRSQCDFLTLIFANISKLPDGRKLFLQDDSFLSKILTFTNSSEPDVRRLGAALILRNCCLETDSHEWLINDLRILPYILLPLMDSVEYEEDEIEKLPVECQYLEESKERVNNPYIRRILVQVLITLCYSEFGWNYLSDNGAYYVVRDLHLWEEDEDVKEAIENFVSYYLVERYSQPKEGEKHTGEDLLIKQLESDLIRDLPDFII